MSKIRSPSLQMESLTRCLRGDIFSCSRGSCMFFFNIFLIYFGLDTNLAYVSKLGEEVLVVNDYLFTSQRESHSLPDRDFFCYTIAYFVPIWVIENRVTNIKFKYFNGNCASCYSSCLGSSILFLYEQAHND